MLYGVTERRVYLMGNYNDSHSYRKHAHTNANTDYLYMQNRPVIGVSYPYNSSLFTWISDTRDFRCVQCNILANDFVGKSDFVLLVL